MTLNLSEAKNHHCRHHPRGSVRRASGFVLTGKPEVIPREELPTIQDLAVRRAGRLERLNSH